MRKSPNLARVMGFLSARSPRVSLECSSGGNADMSFPVNSGKPKNPAAPIYGSWVRVLSGGSKCVQAQPARGSQWNRALPGRQRRLSNPQGTLRIRRNRELQSMVPDFVFCPAAASASRLSLGSILSMKRATSCMSARAALAYNGGTSSGKGFRARRQRERSPFFVWNLIR